MCSPGCLPRSRRLRRARAPLAPQPPVAHIAVRVGPTARGCSADFPPRRWGCSSAASRARTEILINISTSRLSLLGMSPDIPLACGAHDNWGTTDFLEKPSRHTAFHGATYLQHRIRTVRVRDGRRISLSRTNFENCIVVASALVAEIRQTRPVQTRVPDKGVQVRALPSALVVSIGSLVKSGITLGFYP